MKKNIILLCMIASILLSTMVGALPMGDDEYIHIVHTNSYINVYVDNTTI